MGCSNLLAMSSIPQALNSVLKELLPEIISQMLLFSQVYHINTKQAERST